MRRTLLTFLLIIPLFTSAQQLLEEVDYLMEFSPEESQEFDDGFSENTVQWIDLFSDTFNSSDSWKQRKQGGEFNIEAFGSPLPKTSNPNTQNHRLAAEEFSIDLSQSTLVVVEGNKYDTYKYQQRYGGLNVLSAVLQFRYNKTGQLLSISGLHYPKSAFENVKQGRRRDLSVPYEFQLHKDDLVLLPIESQSSNGNVHFVTIHDRLIQSEDGVDVYREFHDSESGQIIYRKNVSREVADLNVTGDVNENPREADFNVPLPNLHIEVGGDIFFTDAAGQVELPIDAPETAVIKLRGPWALIRESSGLFLVQSTKTVNPGMSSLDLSEFNISSRSAYYHVNIMHDFMKQHTPPGFTALDIPIEVRTDYTSGSSSQCNASYNFIRNQMTLLDDGSNCFNMSLFNDIIYHEYAHGITYSLYDFYGGNHTNGALAEAYSDVWAFGLTRDRILAEGYLKSNPGSSIRDYTEDPKVFPDHISGQSHNDAQILAGAWFDLYDELNDFNLWMSLFTNSQEQTRNVLDGFEGQLFRQVLIDVLFEDDNDGDITNGGPNSAAILASFARHGITLFDEHEFIHEELQVVEEGNSVTVDFSIASQLDMVDTGISSLEVYYKKHNESSYTAVPVSGGNGDYSATLPSFSTGDIVNYYIQLVDAYNNMVSYPANLSQNNLPLSFVVGYESVRIEDFDKNMGLWTTNPNDNDSATTGRWEIGESVPSYLYILQGNLNQNNLVQTDEDHTPDGVNCAYTGNADLTQNVGWNDVDNGYTVIESPRFDLSNERSPAISWHRWFTNEKGQNPGMGNWKVEITDDGSNYITVFDESIADKSWRKNIISVEDYVQASANVRLRFTVTDDIGSLVEGALDDLVVYSLGLIDSSRSSAILYPTLTDGGLTIDTRILSKRPQSLTVYGRNGALFHNQTVDFSLFSGSIVLPPALQNGLYIAFITLDDGSVVHEKFVLQR